MGKGINIEFVSDVRRFIGGTKDVGKALDDVADSLDDLSKDAAKAGDKLGDELKDGAETGTDAAKDLERKFKDTLDTVRDDSRKAGSDLGDHIKDGAKDAESGLGDVKDEAKDSAREVAASFDGSLDGVIGGVQELAANMGGLGPIGAAAGLAVAAGAGYFYEEWKKKQELVKELMTSFYEDMLASGQDFASEGLINTNITAIMTDSEDAIVKYTDAQEQAARAGVDLSLVLRAYAGDQDAANQVAAAARARLTELGDDAGSTGLILNGLIQGVTGVGSAAQDAAQRVDVGRAAMQTTGEAARDYATAQAEVAEATTAAQEAVKTNNETIADAETRARANDAVMADMAATYAEVSDKAAAAGVTGAELTAVQVKQYDAFIRAAEGAGIAKDEAVRLAEKYGLVPREIRTRIEVDGITESTETINRWIRDQSGKVIRVRVDSVTGVPVSGPDGRQIARASGGYVDGPGSGTSDSISARLSRGEYVLDAQTVQRIGTGRLDQINNGQIGATYTPTTKPGPVDLTDATIDRLAAAILAGASRVSARALDDYGRAQRAAGR